MWSLKRTKKHSAHVNAYAFEFKTLVGNAPLPLSNFKSKVLLIVNTASKCGFTKQYEDLEKLYSQYQSKGFTILGVPSNDFGSQEPGTSKEIQDFCKINFGVTFPLTSKEKVVGSNAHPFYIWAKERLGLLSSPKWNFHKYLIDKEGEVVQYFYSTTSPLSKNIKENIELLLQ